MSQDPDDIQFDAIAYRAALGGFGTGVALVAAYDAEGRAHGIIVNSLTSVSLEPPIVLWCLANQSSAFDVFCHCRSFSINILGAEAEAHVKRYSRPGDRILPPEEVEELTTGAPVMRAAVASLDCRMRAHQQEGDHEVIFGDVVAYRASPEADALGFFRGRFFTMTAEDDDPS